VHEHLTKRLAELEGKEDNLLDLVEEGSAVAAKVRTRLLAIVEERERVKSGLASQGPLLEAGAALIQAALDLLDGPQELYRQTTDPVRRQLNHVFFDKLYLDDAEVTDRLAAPFDDFLYPHSLSRRRVIHTRAHRVGTPNGATWDAAGGMSASAALLDRSRVARVRVRQQWWSLCASIQTFRERRNSCAGYGLVPHRPDQLAVQSTSGSTNAASA
jgi:hypothetical protein